MTCATAMPPLYVGAAVIVNDAPAAPVACSNSRARAGFGRYSGKSETGRAQTVSGAGIGPLTTPIPNSAAFRTACRSIANAIALRTRESVNGGRVVLKEKIRRFRLGACATT